ncbi:MAG TPA: nuclear transport factor 2 family protein [Mucilaginibacter sp.]
MKTLRAMMMGLALLLVCGASQAATLINRAGLSKEDVITTYLNAVVHGKVDGVDNAIDDNAQFDMKRGDKVNTLDKSRLIDALKSNENVEQNCQCAKTTLQDDDEKNIVKVDMKYADFTRTDVITAEHVGSGWKITKVETSFK